MVAVERDCETITFGWDPEELFNKRVKMNWKETVASRDCSVASNHLNLWNWIKMIMDCLYKKANIY